MEKDLEQEDKKETATGLNLLGEALVSSAVEEDWDLVEEDKTNGFENKMPRPCKRRRIRGNPGAYFFKPAGVRKIGLEEVELSLAEFESIRLVDFEQSTQEEACNEMEISQPTLSRILNSARNKIADSIVNGKAIKINKQLIIGNK